MNNYHTPVLLQEVLTYLSIKKGEIYVDGTLGGAGHTEAILTQGGKVIGIDQDEDAINYARMRLTESGFVENTDFWLHLSNFSQIKSIVEKANVQIAGVLLDLGVSSHQLDEAKRGFSFKEGPLDMRMGNTLTVTAKDLVNGLTKNELEELFMRFGEEPYAKKYAGAIVNARKDRQIESTTDLVKIIGGYNDGVHPATKVFQALRILVNDEMNVLTSTLPEALDALGTNGRLVVISFHSLEDRIVKNSFKEFETNGKARILTDKPIVPTEEEVLLNKRSRSSKLRCIEKI